MKIKTSVDFEEVKVVFARDNALTPERNSWPLGALEIANRQFGSWKRLVLAADELGGIMLPQHDHGVNIIPPSGTTVAEAAKKIGCMDRSTDCYQRIQRLLNWPITVIFLSVAPINSPEYWDYRGIVESGYRGLTHLDGLHRLLAWEQKKRRTPVPAYFAGL